MAMKVLLLRKQIKEKQARMADLEQTAQALQTREAELEASIDEAETEEQLRTVGELMDQFSAEQRANQEAMDALRTEIDADETELRTLEAQQPKPPVPPQPTPPKADERKDDYAMTKKQTRAFGSMTVEQRTAFIQREEVQEFLTRFRTMFANVPKGQQRTVSGGELLIPTVMLELIRENIEDYSKLIRRVRFLSIPGRARQSIMGTIPEAIWTEACAALNELNFAVNEAEVDGYKVGGYVVICNALLEDTDYALLSEIILGIGASIGIATDKAILFGTGVKMPMGIVTRLAQTAKPSDYPESARSWVNLSQSNVITIPTGSTTGLTLFQQIILAAGAAKGRYSRSSKFWVMNEETYTKLQVEATNINAAGAIVSVMDGTMPVVGGDLVVFSDDVMPDNTIVGGYGDLYLLAERAGTSIGYSDLPLYIQDQTVVKGTARYDGIPVIPEGFVVIGVGTAPTTKVSFAPDLANPSVPALRALALGGLTLTPAFDPSTASYTAETFDAANIISAVPTVGSKVDIKVNGKKAQNGAAATWETGENTVTLTVKNGDNAEIYTVSVTKTDA